MENPLGQYPAREWEVVYRDLWCHDSKFVFLCAPNDTHNCLLEAYVRNGVIVRSTGPYPGVGPQSAPQSARRGTGQKRLEHRREDR